MLDIYVDADACPVKREVYRVAQRYGMKVILVADAWMRTPKQDWLELRVVEGGIDAADDWIVAHVTETDIVITGDIPLASRCLSKGAQVIGHSGRPFTEDNIGDALATRDLLAHLRSLGGYTQGPKPFARQDRSAFLQALDQAIQALRRSVER